MTQHPSDHPLSFPPVDPPVDPLLALIQQTDVPWTPMSPAAQTLLDRWRQLVPAGEILSGEPYPEDPACRDLALRCGERWQLGLLMEERTGKGERVAQLHAAGEELINVTQPPGQAPHATLHWLHPLAQHLSRVSVIPLPQLGTLQIGHAHWPLIDPVHSTFLHPEAGPVALGDLNREQIERLRTGGWRPITTAIGVFLTREGVTLFQGRRIDLDRLRRELRTLGTEA